MFLEVRVSVILDYRRQIGIIRLPLRRHRREAAYEFPCLVLYRLLVELILHVGVVLRRLTELLLILLIILIVLLLRAELLLTAEPGIPIKLRLSLSLLRVVLRRLLSLPELIVVEVIQRILLLLSAELRRLIEPGLCV